MSIRRAIGWLGTVAACSAVAQDGPTMKHPDSGADPMSLEQAVAAALTNNEEYGIAQAQLQRAVGRVREANSAFLPTLTANGTYTRLDKATVARIPVGADPDTGDPIFQDVTITKQDQTLGTVIASMPIDISGTLAASRDAFRIGERISVEEVRRVRQQIALNAKTAYYNVIRTAWLVDVAIESVANAEERLRIARVSVQAGAGTDLDVARAETQLAQNQQDLIGARNSLNLAKRAFNSVLGRSIAMPVALREVTELPALDETLESLERMAGERRPELLQSLNGILLQRKLERVARRSALPSLALSAQFNFNPEPGGFGGRKQTGSATALISVPIFDGGAARARVEQQRAETRIAELNYSLLARGVSLEVQQAFLNLANARERRLTAESAERQATEGLRLAKLRYENGVSIQLELSDAELAYTQAKTNVINARYEYLVAWAQLQKATGEVPVVTAQ